MMVRRMHRYKIVVQVLQDNEIVAGEDVELVSTDFDTVTGLINVPRMWQRVKFNASQYKEKHGNQGSTSRRRTREAFQQEG
jgi:hypothetical protein